MKKSNAFSNKSVTFKDLLSNYSIFVLILLVIFAIGFFVNTLGPTYISGDFTYELKNYVTPKDGQYHFTVSAFDVFFASVTPFLVFLMQFSFLHKKSSCYTTLSFNINRKHLYRNRLLLPLLFILFIIILVKIYAFKLNVDVFGLKPLLMQTFFAHLFIEVKIALFSAFCAVFACILCGRTVEAAAAGASMFALPSAISLCIGTINVATLYGATEYSPTIITKIIAALNPLDWSNEYFFYPYYDSGSYGYLPYDQYTPPVPSIVISVIWIIFLCVAFFALGKYFEKAYKPEKCSFKGANVITSSFISITAPLFIILMISQAIIFDLSLYTITTGSLLKNCVMGLIIFLICALACNFLVHFTFKKAKYALIGTLATVIITATIAGINSTDIFNTFNKLPDKSEVKEIYLDFSYENYLNADSSSQSVFSDWADRSYNGFTAETEEEIEMAMNLHKTIVENRDKDTSLYTIITYKLKDGTVKEWEYSLLSEEVALQLMNVRQSEFGKEHLKTSLLPDTIPDEKGKTYKVKVPDCTLKISPLAGSEFYPDISKLSEEDFLSLRTAIYEDVLNLSNEQWYTPTERCLGYINLVLPECDEYGNYYVHYGFPNFATPVYESMKKTIGVLEKLGYMDYFYKETLIEDVYIVDLAKMVDYETDSAFATGTIFSGTDVYLDDTQIENLGTKVEKNQWNSLFEKAYPYYYVGSEKRGTVLIVEFGKQYSTPYALYYIP